MPLLGDIFLDVVYSERPKKSVKTTDHPVEDGNSIVDHIEREPQVLDISGLCNGPDAAIRIKKLENYADTGRRLNYVYLSFFANMVIEEIDITRDVEGGFKFNISLKQITVSKPSVIAQLRPAQKTQASGTNNQGRQQTQKKNDAKRKHTVVRGDSLWKIAQKYYGSANGSKYTLIYNENKSIIGPNPDLIKPGQVLTIP